MDTTKKMLLYGGLVGGLGLAAATEGPALADACRKLPREAGSLALVVDLARLQRKIRKQNLTVPKMFDVQLKKHPDKVMLVEVEGGCEWTYREVEEYSNRIAHLLLARGFVRGDVVAMDMANSVEFVCVQLGLAKIGVIAALVNHRLRGQALAHSLFVAGCKACICDSDLRQEILKAREEMGLPHLLVFVAGAVLSGDEEKVPYLYDLDQECAGRDCSPVPRYVTEQVRHDDDFTYMYTSGTTGMPKAAHSDHARYIMTSHVAGHKIGLGPEDRVYSSLPLYHSAPQWLPLMFSVMFGSTYLIKRRFSVSQFWRDCCDQGATAVQHIGEMARFLLEAPPGSYDAQHQVRVIFGIGMSKHVWKPFLERFKIPRIVEFYAATEGATAMMNQSGKVGAVGSITKVAALLGRNIIRVDPETMEPERDPKTGLCVICRPGEAGEMVSRVFGSDRGGPENFKAYVKNEEETRKKILRDVYRRGDVCFRSGDLMVKDEDGWVYFQDRLGDTFRWRGENVATAQVESILRKILAADSSSRSRDVVVFGVRIPGEEGRAGMAVIFDPEGSLDVPGLSEKVRQELPHFAQPVFVRLARRSIASRNLTSTEKLMRRSLQEEGFDPSVAGADDGDELYFRPPSESSWTQYRRLDDHAYKEMFTQKSKL